MGQRRLQQARKLRANIQKWSNVYVRNSDINSPYIARKRKVAWSFTIPRFKTATDSKNLGYVYPKSRTCARQVRR